MYAYDVNTLYAYFIGHITSGNVMIIDFGLCKYVLLL